MYASIGTFAIFVALSSFSGIARADLAQPGCKCEAAGSTSTQGVAAACTAFGISVLLVGRKRHRQP
ncbi:MAG TPA: hypothetical protein PK156_00435 [Polyangium sp.]|nr:hypothetical protein [Polyangium sp.]